MPCQPESSTKRSYTSSLGRLCCATTPSPPFSTANSFTVSRTSRRSCFTFHQNTYRKLKQESCNPQIPPTLSCAKLSSSQNLSSRPENDNPHIRHRRGLHPSMDNLHEPGPSPYNRLSHRLSSESLGLQHTRPRRTMDADDARLCGINMLSVWERVYRSLGMDD